MKRITVRPSVGQVNDLIDRVVKVGRHEADIFGLHAPRKPEIVSAFTGRSLSDEELDRQLARLTREEQDTFMMLLAKMQGRWVEPPRVEDEGSFETTSSTVTSEDRRNAGRELNGERQGQPPEFGLDGATNQESAATSTVGSSLSGAGQDAGKRPAESDERAELQTPATLEFQPCPKCGRSPSLSDEPIYDNRIPVWHKNCRPIAG